MLSSIKESVINIRPQEVIGDARDRDLDVSSVEDFRQLAPHYGRIEEMMEYYRRSHARNSALGGLTSGIGGIMTAAATAGIDTVSLSIQLYRLAQRFAILNGFDGNDPLQQDKMLNIYFTSLGLNTVMQAAMKDQMLKAHALADEGKANNHYVLKMIISAGQVLGKNLTSRSAGRLIPVVGGVIGATVNYSFARGTSKQMKEAFTDAYFETWQ